MRKPPVLAILLCLVAIAAGATKARAQGPDSQPSAQPPAAAPAASQQLKCPVTTDEDIDPEVYTDYHGRRVFFCCERCKKKFERDPEKYVLHLAADQTQPQSTPEATLKPSDNDDSHAAHAEHMDHASSSGAQDADEHADHEHHHGGSGSFLNWLGNFHPPMTNFPIGVLVAAAVAEALFLRSKAPIFDQAARFGVWFAALTGVGAAFLGWCFGGFRLVDSDPILLTHRWLGTATAMWLLGLLWACERTHRLTPPGSPAAARRGRRLYLVMLFVGAGLVLATGFFGGAMVYGLEHYWS